ncbi:hypothetical protein R1flu_008395 [Riccia fluitans]|uniref:Uncharacterized protein n=1 Tax=Riccia fluitans TaxID=41844 RepID=A0ABD1YBS8_9MARC
MHAGGGEGGKRVLVHGASITWFSVTSTRLISLSGASGCIERRLLLRLALPVRERNISSGITHSGGSSQLGSLGPPEGASLHTSLSWQLVQALTGGTPGPPMATHALRISWALRDLQPSVTVQLRELKAHCELFLFELTSFTKGGHHVVNNVVPIMGRYPRSTLVGVPVACRHLVVPVRSLRFLIAILFTLVQDRSLSLLLDLVRHVASSPVTGPLPPVPTQPSLLSLCNIDSRSP